MRFAFIPLLGALVAGPAVAQGYYQPPADGYAQSPDAWSAAREEWHRAHRAEDIARWRAANGDYEGARRAELWANEHRERAQHEAYVARGGW
jgi:hypothetical protein